MSDLIEHPLMGSWDESCPSSSAGPSSSSVASTSAASTSAASTSAGASCSSGTTPRRRKRDPPPSLPPLPPLAPVITTARYGRNNNSSLRRAERPLDKYCHVAVPHYVDLLDHHRGNIEKYRQSGEWDRAQREQLNAARLAQQLRGVTQEMEAIRSTLDPCDVKEFDFRMQPARHHAMQAIELFIDSNEYGLVMIPRPASPEDWSLHSPTVPPSPSTTSVISASVSASASASAFTSATASTSNATNSSRPLLSLKEGSKEKSDSGRESSGAGSVLGPELVRQQEEECKRAEEDRLKDAAKQRRANLAAWETLQGELVELHDLLSDFAHMVHAQNKEMAAAEAAAAFAMADAQAGLGELEKASKSRTTVYPVVGAILGGCLGGPVGLLAGFKLGSLAAIGGGFLGYTSGALLKKQRDAVLRQRQAKILATISLRNAAAVAAMAAANAADMSSFPSTTDATPAMPLPPHPPD